MLLNIINNKYFKLGLIFIILIFVNSCQNKKESDTGKVEFDPVKESEKFSPLEATLVTKGTHAELGLAGYAKVFCSALFVSGRKPDEAFKNSGFFFMPEDLQDKVTYSIDIDNKSVLLSLGDSITRSARYTGDQGCIINTEQGLQFEPVSVKTSLPDAMTQDWPLGDKIPEVTSSDIDQDLINEAVDLAFSPEEALTAAFLVIHKGEIIAERYLEGINKDTQLESWSMGKSLTATFIGRMIQQGYLNIDDPAPVEEWQQDGDPRKDITIKNLLQMSAGLSFTSHRDPDADQNPNYLDHMYIYTGAVDAFKYSQKRPLQFPVGTVGRYRNCDPLTLGYIMRKTLEANGKPYWTYPQEELFDKIGILRQMMETDPYGNFLLTGYDYGTARNWGRLGMLYLQNGVWNGEQILPEWWTEFVSTKAPAWEEPVYGGLFWINGNKGMPLPEETYYMAGGGGQRTIIVPSMDLVVVRLGHFRGSAIGMESLNKALEKLAEAVTKD